MQQASTWLDNLFNKTRKLKLAMLKYGENIITRMSYAGARVAFQIDNIPNSSALEEMYKELQFHPLVINGHTYDLVTMNKNFFVLSSSKAPKSFNIILISIPELELQILVGYEKSTPVQEGLNTAETVSTEVRSLPLFKNLIGQQKDEKIVDFEFGSDRVVVINKMKSKYLQRKPGFKANLNNLTCVVYLDTQRSDFQYQVQYISKLQNALPQQVNVLVGIPMSQYTQEPIKLACYIDQLTIIDSQNLLNSIPSSFEFYQKNQQLYKCDNLTQLDQDLGLQLGVSLTIKDHLELKVRTKHVIFHGIKFDFIQKKSKFDYKESMPIVFCCLNQRHKDFKTNLDGWCEFANKNQYYSLLIISNLNHGNFQQLLQLNPVLRNQNVLSDATSNIFSLLKKKTNSQPQTVQSGTLLFKYVELILFESDQLTMQSLLGSSEPPMINGMQTMKMTATMSMSTQLLGATQLRVDKFMYKNAEKIVNSQYLQLSARRQDQQLPILVVLNKDHSKFDSNIHELLVLQKKYPECYISIIVMEYSDILLQNYFYADQLNIVKDDNDLSKIIIDDVIEYELLVSGNEIIFKIETFDCACVISDVNTNVAQDFCFENTVAYLQMQLPGKFLGRFDAPRRTKEELPIDLQNHSTSQKIGVIHQNFMLTQQKRVYNFEEAEQQFTQQKSQDCFYILMTSSLELQEFQSKVDLTSQTFLSQFCTFIIPENIQVPFCSEIKVVKVLKFQDNTDLSSLAQFIVQDNRLQEAKHFSTKDGFYNYLSELVQNIQYEEMSDTEIHSEPLDQVLPKIIQIQDKEVVKFRGVKLEFLQKMLPLNKKIAKYVLFCYIDLQKINGSQQLYELTCLQELFKEQLFIVVIINHIGNKLQLANEQKQHIYLDKLNILGYKSGLTRKLRMMYAFDTSFSVLLDMEFDYQMEQINGFDEIVQFVDFQKAEAHDMQLKCRDIFFLSKDQVVVKGLVLKIISRHQFFNKQQRIFIKVLDCDVLDDTVEFLELQQQFPEIFFMAMFRGFDNTNILQLIGKDARFKQLVILEDVNRASRRIDDLLIFAGGKSVAVEVSHQRETLNQLRELKEDELAQKAGKLLL